MYIKIHLFLSCFLFGHYLHMYPDKLSPTKVYVEFIESTRCQTKGATSH